MDCLAFQIHSPSFPGRDDEDLGRGSPYSYAADEFLAHIASLGFDTIQLGPMGMTSRSNPSPYDATIFSRNPLDLPLLRLVDEGRLSRRAFQWLHNTMKHETRARVRNEQAFDNYAIAIREVVANASDSDHDSARAFLGTHASWLVPDCLYDLLCREYDGRAWYGWGGCEQGEFDQRLFAPRPGEGELARERLQALEHRFEREILEYSLVQWLIAEQHRMFRERLKQWNLSVYGDLQVGLSLRDHWASQKLFLKGYRVGAPPSRTNPAGQPWGYAVLDPRQMGTLEKPGPALLFVQARIRKVYQECDGLRIDHPHGWIDPWVYRSNVEDPFDAVQHGARLFSSPDDPLHPELHSLAIARPEQLDRGQLPFADARVQTLDASQVKAYALQLDAITQIQTEFGRSDSPIACEVLSTLPNQVGQAIARHHLGRFRVAQKIKHQDPTDSYRLEHARPEDWVMLGTHDTPPIWELADQWSVSQMGREWEAYLTSMLAPLVRAQRNAPIANDASSLVHALFTAMLVCDARHVVVFFPDLFGMRQRYNEPGVVQQENWSLRVPDNFKWELEERVASGKALSVSQCMHWALMSRENSGPRN